MTKCALLHLLLFAVIGMYCARAQSLLSRPATATSSTPSPASLGNYGNLTPTPSSAYPANRVADEQMRQYEHDRLQQIDFQQSQQAGLEEVYRDMRELNKEKAQSTETVQYAFPSRAHLAGAEYFLQTYALLMDMLMGKRFPDLARAVHAVENAYLGNTYPYDEFDKAISAMTELCTQKLAQDGYTPENQTAKLITLFRFTSDTLQVKHPKTGKTITHYPFRYDFEDFGAEQDWTKLFVSKLIRTGSGQCHSLPLLYLILSQRMNAKAYLAYSPSHMYVKFQDERGQWTNLELTNGRVTSDHFIIGSGYIKAEAIRSRIYMQPMSTEQTLAQCVAELGQGYTRKFGPDSFALQCVETALQYHPNNIYALQLKADYYTRLLRYVGKQLQYPQSLHPYPEAMAVLNQMHALYRQIDDSGYAEMPKEAYQAWLHSVEAAKRQQATTHTNR